MVWNWQLNNWPNFTWDAKKIEQYEALFLLKSGVILGSSQHISEDDKQELFVELLSSEAMDTSLIEGEYLNRESVQSSIKKALGLSDTHYAISRKEQNIASMMVNLYQTLTLPITKASLCDWHQRLLAGNQRIEVLGEYRTHLETMEIVSGPDYAKKIHFIAPPSETVNREMAIFIQWVESTSATGLKPLSPLTRAGLAHIWFESIHPFEDGNGRIGRAIAEKILSQGMPQPMIIALAKTLAKQKKEYYEELGKASLTLDMTEWLVWFAKIILKAQEDTYLSVQWVIEKAKFMREAADKINPRQEKALLRLFKAGPEGFVGGLSAKNYMSITGAAIATTTRDLSNLVAKKLLTRTGERKSTRYHLNIKTTLTPSEPQP